ncbi:MAG: hypothetical protein AB7Q37_15515 [Pyrinomonadaceae bacterium]
MRKSPSFGYASLLVLAVGTFSVILFFMINLPGYADPTEDSLAILVNSLDQVIYAALFGAGAVLVSSILAVIGIIRGERRVPAIISLVICIPILLYLAWRSLDR